MGTSTNDATSPELRRGVPTMTARYQINDRGASRRANMRRGLERLERTSEDYGAWAEALGPDRSKRLSGRRGGYAIQQVKYGTRKLIKEADEEKYRALKCILSKTGSPISGHPACDSSQQPKNMGRNQMFRD